jgi:hypothetical protein
VWEDVYFSPYLGNFLDEADLFLVLFWRRS